MKPNIIDVRSGFGVYWDDICSRWSFQDENHKNFVMGEAFALWEASAKHTDACDTRYFDGLADGQTQYREMLGTAVKIIRGLLASDDLAIGYGEYIGDANTFLAEMAKRGK